MTIAEIARKAKPSELVWESLGAYHLTLDSKAGDEYANWCQLVGLIPSDPAADQFFMATHQAYADLWMTMGDDTFFGRVSIYAARWRERAGGSSKARSFTRWLRGGAHA